MTANSSQSLPPARRSAHRTVLASFLAIAPLCALFCAGCKDNSATGYHEYTGSDTTQSTGSDAKAAPTAETASADKSKQPANSTAAPAAVTETAVTAAVDAAAVDAGEAPVVAIKPEPGNAAGGNSLGAGQATIATPVAPRVPKVLVTERKFQVAGPENAIRVSYDDLDLMRVLNMEPVTPDALSLMPEWLKSLEGKRVRLRGFMFPGFESHDLAGFGFARDNDICCFVRKPKVYDVFQVKLRDGVTADFVANRPVDVVGVFHFQPDHEDWNIAGMYFIEDAIVIDKR